MLPKMNVYEFLESFTPRMTDTKKLVNVRGTNGSGKSTIPFSMLAADPKSFELTYAFENRERVIATVFPTLGWLALGSYRTACGGLDSYKTTEQTFDSIRLLWDLPFNILMEGVISSTVRGSYQDFFKSVNGEMEKPRDIIIFTLLPPFETCLARIQVRNGGKAIKQDQVLSKYRTIERNVQHFKDAGLDSRSGDNSIITKEETLSWFLTSIGESPLTVEAPEMRSKAPAAPVVKTGTQSVKPDVLAKPGRNNTNGKSKDTKIKEIAQSASKQETLYLPTEADLSGHEWAKYYKAPEGVIINWDNMRLYWYWIAERMSIWYSRTVLKNPRPWTSDKILQEYSFTNVIRDLDKGTILYINNILKKIDEPTCDLVKRKKEIVLNTMIYRLFIRKETMDAIGWFFELDKWDTQWEHAKSELRRIKKSGEPVFHNAYYINDLHAASPSPDNHDKTENAINLIETFWKPRLDEIYEFVTSHDMKDTLDFLSTLCCVGLFTAYEWVCDFALCHRHTKNIIVDWDDDSYVNVGPGNKRGLDYIFIDKGNLSYHQCNFYLRASWKHYMQRYGYLPQFLSQLPEFMRGDINLRVIEHDLCEASKYLSAYYEIGRPKAKFGDKSRDNLESLIL